MSANVYRPARKCLFTLEDMKLKRFDVFFLDKKLKLLNVQSVDD